MGTSYSLSFIAYVGMLFQLNAFPDVEYGCLPSQRLYAVYQTECLGSVVHTCVWYLWEPNLQVLALYDSGDMPATDSFCLFCLCRQEGLESTGLLWWRVPTWSLSCAIVRAHMVLPQLESQWLTWFFLQICQNHHVCHLEAFNEGIIMCTCHSKVLMAYTLACSIVSLLEARW